MTAKALNPATLSPPKGPYAQGLLLDPGKTWLFTTGQVALTANGAIPEAADAQCQLVWEHLLALLAEAGMTVANIVKTNVYATSPEVMVAHNKVRNAVLGTHTPTTTAVVVSALANSKYLIEVDLIACR